MYFDLSLDSNSTKAKRSRISVDREEFALKLRREGALLKIEAESNLLEYHVISRMFASVSNQSNPSV